MEHCDNAVLRRKRPATCDRRPCFLPSWRRVRQWLLAITCLHVCAVSAGPYTPLDVKGLDHAPMIQAIYYGQFERIPIADAQRVGVITNVGTLGRYLFLSYVTAFSDLCQSSLSPNKVAIAKTVTTVSQRLNAYNQVFSEQVINRETKSPETWAEPEYATTYVNVANTAGFDGILKWGDEILRHRDRSIQQSFFNVIGELLRLSTETAQLIQRHGCDSAELQNYAGNLLSYVRMAPPKHQLDVFAENCSRRVSSIIPGADPKRCLCIKSAFKELLDGASYWALEDDFTERRVLLSAVSKVGLADKVARCVR